jgi:hypothetical protein
VNVPDPTLVKTRTQGVFLITNGTEDIGRSAPLVVLGACGFVCGVDGVIRGEAIIIWNLMVRALALLLLLICSGNATELLRDFHTDTTYVFNSDANDVRARISQNDGVRIADEWAARFYDDAKFQFVACQYKTKPIRTNN